MNIKVYMKILQGSRSIYMQFFAAKGQKNSRLLKVMNRASHHDLPLGAWGEKSTSAEGDKSMIVASLSPSSQSALEWCS